jgi:hypothetical protein
VARLATLQPITPYRGAFGAKRPARVEALPLPPKPMPPRDGLRPLKAWRYVGIYGPDLMLCVGAVRIGPARQAFWAIWDRAQRTLYERTVIGRGTVRLEPGRVRVLDPDIQIDVTIDETPGVEIVCPSGGSYAWTRKQGGIPAHGVIAVHGEPHTIEAMAVVDDTAAYYERHTRWLWSAGVGTAADGLPVAWNLVDGVNDPDQNSERTVWLAGQAHEAPRSAFDPDLSAVDGLRFTSEAVRERRDNLLLVRSSYRQPFGTFSGALPGGIELTEGFGVMEEHEVWW